MARINTSLQGGASLPVDASLVGKRQRGGGDSNTDNDADNDRANKRSRKDDNEKRKNGEKKSKRGSISEQPRRSNRDRNSGDGNNWWQATESSTNDATESPAGVKEKTKPRHMDKAKKSKAGRPPKSAETRDDEATEATPSSKINPKKAKTKPLRPEKLAEVTEPAEPSKPSEPNTTTSKPKRGRPRKSDAGAEAADSPTADSPVAKKLKKSKSITSAGKSPRASKKSTAAETSPTTTSPQGRSKKSPRQSGEGEGQEQEDNEDDGEEEEEEEDVNELQHPFRQLVPRTRLVPLATMTNKWAPLDRDAIAAVQSLLDECARPVLARLGSSTEKKDRQDIARQAVAAVTRRLRSKLVKGIPFPSDQKSKKKMGKPTPTEVSFLGEPTAETHALQSQLTPLQHAVALLASERRREEAALADEYAQLRALETNAQAEQRTWRERQRRQHVLAVDRGQSQFQDMDSQGSRVGLRQDSQGSERDENATNGKEKPGLFSDSFDSSVVDLASLGSHMDSIRGNLQQMDGVVAAMARSRAALQEVLGERLSGDQYERVLLGR